MTTLRQYHTKNGNSNSSSNDGSNGEIVLKRKRSQYIRKKKPSRLQDKENSNSNNSSNDDSNDEIKPRRKRSSKYIYIKKMTLRRKTYMKPPVRMAPMAKSNLKKAPMMKKAPQKEVH
ncbi:hypothetical protein F8M41_021339 [Gigaspora margarita]|uniref:Uncharacterized protein n=1 Tax=Gigaspora margarita TaxID=4874 RepID=A0A8H4B1J1_GIGMA|nr:hypothetical protein F8M41_021339 [Gigaspora margarita]